MKKIFLITFCITAITGAYAQKTSLGFSAGSSISNFKAKSDAGSETADSKVGLMLSITTNITAGNNFIIQPGINWVQKGTKSKETFFGITEKTTLNTNYIELPLNFLYSNNGFVIDAGPTFSFGVSGKVKYDDGTNKTSENIKFGSGTDDHLKRFDMGATLLTGYHFKNGLFMHFNYNLGMSNLFVSKENNASVKTRYAGVRIGYLLKGKANKNL